MKWGTDGGKDYRAWPAFYCLILTSSRLQDDSWMRDVGQTFVRDANKRIRGVDWSFNAWGGLEGGLYYPWDKD